MNTADRKNLNFLLSLNDSQFDQFMEDATDDELDYAIELLKKKRTQNLLEEMDLLEQTNQTQHTQAKYVLDQIRNKSIM
jgi:hypothetical protein